MSTRAIYTFRDDINTFHVYKHHDGYPHGAVDAIKNALNLAWDLPRFEADEFAAAFIAANKTRQGGIRLTNYQNTSDFSSDIEYCYLMDFVGGRIIITAFETAYNAETDSVSLNAFFNGSIEEFAEKYGE